MQNNAPIARNGFTLIELLIATIISAMAAILILDAVVDARKRQNTRLNMARATLVAQEIISMRSDATGPPRSLNGAKSKLLWNVEETEISHDPRERYILVNIKASVGTINTPGLITLSRRQLRAIN